jgi:hypothetical protein
MKNLADNGTVPSGLSQQELKRLAEYFSILRDWSLQRNNLKDRDDDTSTPKATTSVDVTKSGVRERPKSAIGDRRSRRR